MAETITAELQVDQEVQEVKEEQKVDEVKEEKQSEKTFTQDEVNKIVADRLAREQKLAEKREEEAKKLAKMNAEEKLKYEQEQREKQFAERERAIEVRELTAQAKEILSEKNLPLDLHTILNYKDADTVSESIKVVEKAIQVAVENKVEERLKGHAPKVNTSTTKSAFERMQDKYNKKK